MLLVKNRTGASRRPGTVIVVVTLSLVAILSFLALSLDAGLLVDNRRNAQSAADAAALAAAGQLYANWHANGTVNQGLDPYGTAAAAARAVATANGFADGVAGCTVTVNIPPLSGLFAGKKGHAEVIITSKQEQFFSRIFGTYDLTYGARAVARGRSNQINNAIITLNPSGKGSLSSGGGGVATIQGAPIQVNSNDSQAMIGNGNGTLTAPQFLVTGSPGWATPGGGSFNGPIVPNSTPIPDPLANLPYPDPLSLPVRSSNKTQNSGNKTLNLQPGVYQGGISATGGTINLAPGIYYMQGGGFNIGGQANLSGAGVMIFNQPVLSSDVVSIAGSGNVSLSPPTSGPYKGIEIFQNRTATQTVSISGSSGASMTITGAFYAAGANLSVTGNGSQQTIGSQYISYDLTLGGNGTFFCNWDPAQTPGVREIGLVE